MADLGTRESDFTLKGASDTVIFQPSNPLMEKPRLRERDMRPQRIFFYERITDNKIMALSEQEAAMMEKSSHRQIIRQLGCSDGSTYGKFLRECGVKSGEVILKTRAQEILDGAFAAELEAARGHFDRPQDQNVHFDTSFPIDQRTSFVPPA